MKHLFGVALAAAMMLTVLVGFAHAQERGQERGLLPGEVRTVDDIPPDSGAILRRGLTKIAVYRSKNGELYERSAVCPHLGCVVQWNNIEKTWDCPCHGSRFEKFGAVVNGPSIHDMKAVKSHFEEEVHREH